MADRRLDQVAFIHPRFGRDGTPIDELLAKFEVYGESLSTSSNGALKQLIILAGIDKGQFEKINQKLIPSIRIIRISNPTNDFFTFALKSLVSIRRSEIKPGLIVAGDFWVGGLSAYILVKLFRMRSKTQITLHGNPLNTLDRGLRIKSRFRKIFFRFMLHNFDSIRLVSSNLLPLLRFDFQNLSPKVLVSPVYMPAIQTSHVTADKRKSITIMGRLHEERNPLEALSSIRKILAADTSLQVDIVGNGPMQQEILEFCKREFSETSFTFWGWLAHKDALTVLASSTVLISSAPEEGYGQTIREALTLGIPVVARRNSETLELSHSWPGIIKTYEYEKDATQLVLAYLENPPQESDFSEFRVDLRHKVENSLKRLTQSWVDLASRQS